MTNPNANIKILVAEDNPAVREFIVRALQTIKADVQAVCDGQQALAALSESTYDLLITDIVMPNVDGIALTLQASQQYPALRLIMISGYAQERMRAHNLDVLVHKIIAKPFSLEELNNAVLDVMAMPLRESPPSDVSF